MRRLYWAVPFLLYNVFYSFWVYVLPNVVVAFFNLLTFLIEYRYGGESKEGEELVVFGIALSSLLLPVGDLVASFASALAGFMFFLELTAAFVKTHRV